MRNRMRLTIPAITLLLTLPLASDTLHMRDGQVIKDVYVEKLESGVIWVHYGPTRKEQVPKTQIRKIEKGTETLSEFRKRKGEEEKRAADAARPTSGGYRDNGDGTVADLRTNRIWQRCSVGQNNDAECSGEAQQLDWETAVRTCSELRLASQSWRLPDKDELKGLVRCSDGTPTPLKENIFVEHPWQCGWSGGKNYGKEFQSPTIDGVFTGTVVADPYWSSSSKVRFHEEETWLISFNNGHMGTLSKDYSAYVRCVATSYPLESGEERRK